MSFQRAKSIDLPDEFSLVWLSQGPEDFEKCTSYFSDQTNYPAKQWRFFDDEIRCFEYLKSQSKQKLVLISSGRLLTDIIDYLQLLPQIHSIYIYCQKIDKYTPLKTKYGKVRGIFDDPIQLLDQLCQNLDHESVNIVRLKEAKLDLNLPCLFGNQLASYSLPNTPWLPWETPNSTLTLPAKGKGTIELWLSEPFAFEFSLSNNSDTNRYALVLKADTREVRLSILDGNTLHVKDSTEEHHQVVQTAKGSWHCYWLTFFAKDRLVQYGMGEIRPKFKILEAQLSDREKSLSETIAYLNLKINNRANLNSIEDLKDKIKIFIGKEPIIFDPPLLIISPDDFSATDPTNNIGILASSLKSPLKDLYEQVLSFSLEDEHFPHLINAIERSIQNPNGWCHKKLSQKANLFGRPRKEATYLSLLIYEGKNQCSLVMKIWPPGHYTPIHNHGDISSVIRVLHGKLLVKYFPILSIHHPQNDILEQTFEKNSITWMIPKLNQIQQMKNPDMYGSCCIAIQCYHQTNEQSTFSERFDYITNDGRHVHTHQCVVDQNYSSFQNIIRTEWTAENPV